MSTLYLAGGLFNIAQRAHNLQLERHLERLGHEVILPQREASKHVVDGRFDLPAVVEECVRSCIDRANIVVACCDGPDADSGTAIEFGLAIQATQRALVYRTDFRTEEGSEVGVNAMFRCEGSICVYVPCFVSEFDEIDGFYSTLAARLHEVLPN